MTRDPVPPPALHQARSVVGKPRAGEGGMTNGKQIIDLIARLEAAPTEGSRELDVRISRPDEDLGKMQTWWFAIDTMRFENVGDVSTSKIDLSYYTTSLDAALPGENIIEMYRFGPDLKFRVRHSWGDGQSAIGEHKSEAIARRIAALKARAT